MPALSDIGKGHSKIKLNNYFINHLKAGLESKARLTTKLKTEMDKWENELAAVPDSDIPISLPLNRNENVAFVARIKENAASHDLLLGKYQDMMADGTNFGKGFNTRLKKSRLKVHQDAQEWDSNQRAYDREVDSYDERSKDKSSKYHEALADLKIRLNTLRIKYNQSYMFEEFLTDQTRMSYFINTETCLGYIPTQHKWHPKVGGYTDKFTKVTTKGTYVYDLMLIIFSYTFTATPTMEM